VAASRARSAYLAEALDDARRLQGAVERRVQAGELPRSELLLAERGTLSLEVEWLGAGAAQERAEAAWRFHTGLEDAPGDLLETAFTAAEIDARHPGLVLAHADAGRAAAEQRRVRSDRRANPVVNVGARHERGDADEPWNDAIAVGINVPLGLPSQSAPAAAAARVAAVETGVARERTWRALNEALIAARSTLEFARRELDAARRVEALAAESLRLAQLAFDVGEEDLFKLLQMKTQALEAGWNAARLDLAVGRAIARCNQAGGLVPGDDSR
jgi:outer membrane protein TolC